MNAFPKSPGRLVRNFFHAGLLVLACCVAHAADVLKLDLASDRQSAAVVIPDGVAKITIEHKDARGRWQALLSARVVPGKMTFDLPSLADDRPWRAVVSKKGPDAQKRKFPAAFYQGKKEFGPSLTDGGGGLGLSRVGIMEDQVGAVAASPVEADIWKIDGNRIYYFNQLRGLQVLDLANPADPRLIASLRMPATGEDLYLLPGSGESRELLLLTQDERKDLGSVTTIKIVKLTGNQLTVTSTQDVPGYLNDSRMVGNRLILATTRTLNPVAVKSGNSLPTNVSEWLVESGKDPKQITNFPIRGDSPLIAAGSDWLAVATYAPGRAGGSLVNVFAIRPDGLVRMGETIHTAGTVLDKFKMQWSKNTLTVISEVNSSETRWSPKTVLENFLALDPETAAVVRLASGSSLLGKLDLGKGESLYATRFDGDKVYIVTFLQKDPLWIVDLADPAKPKIAGHVKVPGRSTYLQPLGNLLFSIGWESGSVAASLFDVSDVAKPTLLRRITLGDGTWSEAAWNEKALKVLPDAGVVMVPVVTYAADAPAQVSGVQLLDLDIKGRDLKKRGIIAHDFEALRADLLGDSAVSISQRVLVAANISDRDAPAVISEVSLAWPADRVCDAGDYLVQIENGTTWGGGLATARVSPANDPEQILAETDMKAGVVGAADLRDGKLYVVRQLQENIPWIGVRSLIPRGGNSQKLVLDVYDASALPALTWLGSCSVDVGTGFGLNISDLLWPQPTRPTVVVKSQFPIFWAYASGTQPLLMKNEPAKPALKDVNIIIDPPRIFPPFIGGGGTRPQLVVFNVTTPESPSADTPVSFGAVGTTTGDVSVGGGSLVVVGAAKSSVFTGPRFSSYLYSQQNMMNVFEIGLSGPAVARPEIDLPGSLFAVTDLSGSGFLAYTRSAVGKGLAEVQVSACDGFDAFLVASRQVPIRAAVAASGRRLFVAAPKGISRLTLAGDGTWSAEPDLVIGWRPTSLRTAGGKIFGTGARAFFAADAGAAESKTWKFPAWSLLLDGVKVAENGDLLAPFGSYGAQRLGLGK